MSAPDEHGCAATLNPLDAKILDIVRSRTSEYRRIFTYVIRNTLRSEHGIYVTTSHVRRSLGRLEKQGLTTSRKWSSGCMIEYWAVSP